jgi:hypothetical protein
VVKLPADLVVDGFWSLRVRKADGFDGIGGSTECVGAHMANGDGLASGTGSGFCGRGLYLIRTDATGKPAVNPLCSV